MSIRRESRRATPSCENAVPVMLSPCDAASGRRPCDRGDRSRRSGERERRERHVARKHERELAQDAIPRDARRHRGRDRGRAAAAPRSSPRAAGRSASARPASARRARLLDAARASRARCRAAVSFFCSVLTFECTLMKPATSAKSTTRPSADPMTTAGSSLRKLLRDSEPLGRRLTARISPRSRGRLQPRASRTAP